MTRLFIDTNIVIDLLSKREPHYAESAILFSLADRNKIALSVSALTFANTAYVLLKQLKTGKVKEILRKLRVLIQVLPLDDKTIGLALNDESFADFEDGLQYYTALENDMDIIITRNLKDFKSAKIPVMTAEQFIETFHAK
jgi:predicted nucleic acid-binding protein